MRRLLAVLVAIAFAVPGLAAEGQDRADRALAVSKRALGQTMPDLSFTDTDGRQVRLADFRGRPLLVTLVYTSCADVCPTLVESLYPAVEVAQETFGEDGFSVVTVGFDVKKDTPKQMRAFARARGADLPNWSFLSADQANLDGLARAVGFAFYGRAGGFDHLAQVSIVDGDGRLYQQVYGAVFEPPLLVEPLKNLIFGRDKPLVSFQGLIDRIKLFCTTYDPNSGRYYFNYSLFIGIGIGMACLGLVLALLVREWRRSGPSAHGSV